MSLSTQADCVVTGGAGFIGSHLVRALVSEGRSVRVADDMSTGTVANLEGVRGVEIRRCDLLTAPLDDLLSGVQTVFHLAAVPSVPRSVREPFRSHEVAATATLRLLIAARDAGVRRFITSSSSSVYGDIARPPMREDMPVQPRSPYGVAKLAAEGYTRVWAQLFGMNTISLRYFNVFGPRQDPTSSYAAAIPRFVTAYLRGESPTVYGDGRQSRDFTYVDNVVHANLLAERAAHLSGEVANIAAGEPRTVLDVLDAISRQLDRRIEPTFVPPRLGDILHSHADTTLARRLLGYAPRVSFEDGLRATIDWLARPAAMPQIG